MRLDTRQGVDDEVKPNLALSSVFLTAKQTEYQLSQHQSIHMNTPAVVSQCQACLCYAKRCNGYHQLEKWRKNSTKVSAVTESKIWIWNNSI